MKMEDINRKECLWSAIRKKCLECSGDYIKEVEKCSIKKCPLYPYRFGKSEKQWLQSRQKCKK